MHTSNGDYSCVRELRAELAVHGHLIQLRLTAHFWVVGIQEVRCTDLKAVEAPMRKLCLQPLRRKMTHTLLAKNRPHMPWAALQLLWEALRAS